MPKVFINYRTGDGDEAAALLYRELSDRFGEDMIFRAAASIQPGDIYARKLIDGVRNSDVLLAVMSPDWPRYSQLRDESDWVRREIMEAHAAGIRVIPVLKGRKTDRLKASELPPELAWLADVQSLLLDMRDNKADLARIGDELAELVPSLREADRSALRSPEPGVVRNSASDIHGPVVQGRDITGDIGETIVKGTHGPVHAGKGDINQHFAGPPGGESE
jgi:TIR domain-containing protein